MTAQVTVLCVTGWCRNGSTIMGNILNELAGVTHVGELHFLWKNSIGAGANSRCGCGQPLTGCPQWSAVLADIKPAEVPLERFAAQVIARQRRCVRTRHTWRVLRTGLADADLRAHAELMARAYQAIAVRTGASIIVDSSKMPGEAALLPQVAGIRPVFAHLVREPHAVAESWRAPKEYIYPLSATKSTSYWTGFNLASEAISRRYPQSSARVRYEEFLSDPSAVIDQLIRLCGADAAANPVTGRLVSLGRNHTVTGNPDRFRAGLTELRPTDDRWVTELPARSKLAVTTIAWPLLGRYGYGRSDPRTRNRTRKEPMLGHRA
jgi:sulfotransferase family protein